MMGGLKLRQGSDSTRLPMVDSKNGISRQAEAFNTGSANSGNQKPLVLYVLSLVSVLILISTLLFNFLDSINVFEVAYKAHALVGLVVGPSLEPELPPDNFQGYSAQGFGSRQAQERALEVHSFQKTSDGRCQENSTDWAHIFGLPNADQGESIHLSTGSIHSLRLVSFDSAGQHRCKGGDYYETELRSINWKSRPPVIDLGNGSYDVILQVHTKFAGQYVFEIFLLPSNIDGLKQFDQRQDKLVTSLNIEFVRSNLTTTNPCPKSSEPPEVMRSNVSEFTSSDVSSDPISCLKLCNGADFELTRWNGRWTRRPVTNSNCSMGLGENKRLRKSLKSEMECKWPQCKEGFTGSLESNGWVYSAHCSFRLFSRNEAWRCLDRKWLFWWGDSGYEQRTVMHTLLQSVLGLTRPAQRWDTIGRFSNKMIVRRTENTTTPAHEQQQHRPKSAESRDLKQQVRMTTMWNTDVELDPDQIQGAASYFTKLFSPDIVIMNSGIRDGSLNLRNWTELRSFGVQNATIFWKETFELSNRYPRVVFTASGASLQDINPQVSEMWGRFASEAYSRANLTSDFRILDGFDYSLSWMGRYERKHHFVDLMFVHMLLNAICVD